MRAPLRLTTAVLGGEATIGTISGDRVRLKVPPATQQGQVSGSRATGCRPCQAAAPAAICTPRRTCSFPARSRREVPGARTLRRDLTALARGAKLDRSSAATRRSGASRSGSSAETFPRGSPTSVSPPSTWDRSSPAPSTAGSSEDGAGPSRVGGDAEERELSAVPISAPQGPARPEEGDRGGRRLHADRRLLHAPRREGLPRHRRPVPGGPRQASVVHPGRFR